MTWKADIKTWIGRIVTVLICMPFVMSFIMTLHPTPEIAQNMARFGFPENLLSTIGIIEISCVVVYLIPQTSVLGAILLTGYLGGAVCTHLRVGDPVHLPIIFGVVIWLGLWLREPRLRQILPLR